MNSIYIMSSYGNEKNHAEDEKKKVKSPPRTEL